ncbi:hypothetical protein GCM10010211_36610 [Streptomyces albospinus]|uniref:Uncharacterized protein n=1 Tax=Streptomyces albospinus TaxID=285515 RepID=A0ABQ2V6I9_9ACTN|nr:hypothetical protein GCM10010211_36610 [Streptomyces albospinus]
MGGMNQKKPSSGDSPLAQGRIAAQELASALASAGFTFPSLHGDFPVMNRAHVQLGGMSAAEAFRLAAWIRERTEMRGQRP